LDLRLRGQIIQILHNFIDLKKEIAFCPYVCHLELVFDDFAVRSLGSFNGGYGTFG